MSAPLKAGPEARLHLIGRLAAVVAAMLLPKCFVCLAAYASVALGFAAAPELCGGTERAGPTTAEIAIFVGAGLAMAVYLLAHRRCARPEAQV